MAIYQGCQKDRGIVELRTLGVAGLSLGLFWWPGHVEIGELLGQTQLKEISLEVYSTIVCMSHPYLTYKILSWEEICCQYTIETMN
jgi:hypothetical protein